MTGETATSNRTSVSQCTCPVMTDPPGELSEGTASPAPGPGSRESLSGGRRGFATPGGRRRVFARVRQSATKAPALDLRRARGQSGAPYGGGSMGRYDEEFRRSLQDP